MKLIHIPIFFSLLCFATGCVENAKPDSFQYIRLYTDLPKTIDSSLFFDFEKKNGIKVLVHHANTKYILEKIKNEKWQSNMDAILLRNGINLNDLKDFDCLDTYFPERDSLFWQPLFSDPFVFHFPKDTVDLFTSYGQIFRNEKVRIDADSIRSFEQSTNLISLLKAIYPIYSMHQIQNKILHSDSLKGKDIMHVQISLYSQFDDELDFVFPDQYYKGSVGIVGGISIMRQAPNLKNVRLLYRYCKQSAWRKKLAKELHLFPILSPEENRAQKVILYPFPPK